MALDFSGDSNQLAVGGAPNSFDFSSQFGNQDVNYGTQSQSASSVGGSGIAGALSLSSVAGYGAIGLAAVAVGFAIRYLVKK